jgi:hypothetical protein
MELEVRDCVTAQRYVRRRGNHGTRTATTLYTPLAAFTSVVDALAGAARDGWIAETLSRLII